MNSPDTGKIKRESNLSWLTLAWRNYSFWAEWRRIRPNLGFMTRYSPVIFFFLVSTLGLNVLDCLLTMMIIDLKGHEANPVMQSVMTLYGSDFWIWKFGVVSLSLVLLCILSELKVVKGVIVTMSSIYFTVVLYQLLLLTHIS
jgi:hypothetical protein